MDILKRSAFIGIKAVRNFFEDGGLNLAAAISFYALLSIFPFILLMLSLLDRLLGLSDERLDTVIEFMRNFMPEVPTEAIYRFRDMVSRGDNSLINVVGILLLLWMTHLVFSSLEYALNAIFRKGGVHSLWKGRLKSLVAIIFLAVLLVLSFLWNSILSVFKGINPGIPDRLLKLVAGPLILQYLVPAGIALVFFMILYKTFPHTRVKLKYAFAGAMTATVFWEMAKHVFGIYVKGLPTYGILFGSMAATVVFLMWIYFASGIILLGAEVVALLNGERNGAVGEDGK